MEVTLESSFDAETIFNAQQKPDPRTVPHFLLDGLVINARSQICQEFAPIFLDVFEQIKTEQDEAEKEF